MKKLVIAEKPSVAKDIAKILNCREKKEGFLEGNDYIITWAIGHLVILCDPEEYDLKYKRWSFENLPIIPKNIKLKPNPKTYKQYQVVKKLFNDPQVNEIICATDAGREGELIFRYIYEICGCKKPFKRLWISSLTEKAIKEGFENLKNGKDYDALYHSAKCRSESDWLVGINGSRAYSIKYNSLLPIGRVQTPTLKMIVDRDLIIEDFKPTTYWEVKANFHQYNGTWIDLEKNSTQIETFTQAEKIKNKVLHQQGKVVNFQKKKTVKKPPLLYDLTELQRDANKKFGYTAQTTLNIAQKLYETRKLITYPRTDSRYLSKDLISRLNPLITKVGEEGYKEYTTYLEKLNKLPITSRIINDSKVSDHHAIIPTEKKGVLSKLSSEERNLYDLIVKRFLAVFYPNYEYFSIMIITEVEQEFFKSNEQETIQQGWKKIYYNNTNENKKTIDIKKDDRVTVGDVTIEEKQTEPPKRYNEALLLSAMENAGKFVEEEILREQLKENGIGTPATRAAIIERLIEVGYVERKGKNLQSTVKGRKLIQVTSEVLASPEMTGKWERALNKIAKGQMESSKFMEGIYRFTAFIIDDVMKNGKHITFEKDMKIKNYNKKNNYFPKESLGDCPACGEGKIMEGSKSFYCSNYKKGCKFGLFKEDLLMKRFKKKITKTIVQQLIKGNVTTIKGMTSPKTGGKFDGKIRLKQQENGYWGWEFTS